VYVVGGCVEVPGAVVLASMAALRAGVGRVQIATVRGTAASIGLAVPEARVIGLREGRRGELDPAGLRVLSPDLGQADAVLMGPGMGPDGAPAARSFVRMFGAHAPASSTLILDAGGLMALERDKPLPRRGTPVIVTPHSGEMARLWGVDVSAVRRHPLAIAREAAAHFGMTVVLKGEMTYIATAGRTLVNDAGTVGLGTAGSGDVLAGIIAGLCARGATADQAAAWGVYLHAKAGEELSRHIGPLGFLARELLDDVPRLMARIGRAT
jgi:ADP-dependent NAD(P)H-hydrate dehydratase